jgi:hypothetical protein
VFERGTFLSRKFTKYFVDPFQTLMKFMVGFRRFWSILAYFGSFLGYFGLFWGHFGPKMGGTPEKVRFLAMTPLIFTYFGFPHFRCFLTLFEPFLAYFGGFWPIFGGFWPILGSFLAYFGVFEPTIFDERAARAGV